MLIVDEARPMAGAMLDAKLRSIHAMLNPKSVAIVGATEKAGYGGNFLKNLLASGSKARHYPINPNRTEVDGTRCYPSVTDLPEAPDLVGIVLPAQLVVPTFEACVAKGAKSVLIISAGFAELGTDEGRARQERLRDIARESGVRLCGPNCLGLANVAAQSWTTPSTMISPNMHTFDTGIGLVSQSGATCYRTLLPLAEDRGIGFSSMICTGNEADLETSDFMQYMIADPGTKVIAAVIEGFKDGAKFAETADLALRAGKPIVILKVGRSEVGARGANSHTAAMTGSDTAHDALFRQKGVVRVNDYDELVEFSAMFAKAKAPRGPRIGVSSESGGISTHTADKCGELGLEVPPLSPETREKMVAIMGDRGSAANPADLTQFGVKESFEQVLDILLGEDNQDLLILSSVGGPNQAKFTIAAIENAPKPILFVWNGSARESASLPLLKNSNVPLFFAPVKAAQAARALVDYHRTRRDYMAEVASGERQFPLPPAALAAFEEIVRGGRGVALNEYASKQALSLFGVRGTREILCREVDDAIDAARSIGFPVAMKIASDDIPHKTEAGGVRLGLKDADEVARAFGEMLVAVRGHHPQARIDGVLIQEMVSDGLQLIVGVSRDAHFGPVLMLGLGGILAEAMAASSWRVCPITSREAHEMIGEVRGLSKIAAGYRGLPKADIAALVDTLVNISRLAVWAGDSVESLDINPLAVRAEGRGVVALDALLVPRVAEPASR
ncbi:acetate--CoA ligase family protein [Starkeya sp. ORNL1]|uniref:acetate--CoA ligase family protein n=1 Tax=Starkeya sp. ORNL1 TaxID=2709380 RepID=UPI0014648B53|nr:acetate--CoA ligase family protein [Starkeya sp. ORNL1]QJP16967.1 acetate--CoA ligase family protein [Starkeya sp. ORNL1]